MVNHKTSLPYGSEPVSEEVIAVCANCYTLGRCSPVSWSRKFTRLPDDVAHVEAEYAVAPSRRAIPVLEEEHSFWKCVQKIRTSDPGFTITTTLRTALKNKRLRPDDRDRSPGSDSMTLVSDASSLDVLVMFRFILARQD